MPQEDNNENVMNLDNNSNTDTNTQETNSNTSDDNKKDETKTTEKQETKSDKGERLYTQDELNDIISRRLAKFFKLSIMRALIYFVEITVEVLPRDFATLINSEVDKSLLTR